MNLHANAALSWTGRRRLCELVVDDGWTVAAAAASAGVSVRCARKWVGRYTAAGEAGLVDRSSAPKRVANRRAPDRVEAIAKLRRLRFTAAEIAETLGMALSTVSGILTRIGMGKLGRLGLEQPIRYERSRPGELVHIDIKKLARIKGGAGWRVRGGAQQLQQDLPRSGRPTATDRRLRVRPRRRRRLQPTRLRRGAPGREGILSNQLPPTRDRFLSPPRRRGRTDPDRQRLRLPRRHARGRLPPARDTTHPRTRPYRPQTNGKAERFIRTLLYGWAYGAIYGSSQERTRALDGRLWHHNHRRRHSALGHQPPVSRTNLLGSYT